ncbi:hypothetical protein BDN72DRAFT_771551 [Pluteus cervinus]|uniref:Uncharacterized protein n=1 Tax=Pluteus cervinus TaxID=181527 RepID=A0ACD3AML8_9AGAR|nr:hypothetical protein BDN72DRAFT_771551 [Pluteus cervinus]
MSTHPSALPRYHGVSTRLKTLPSSLVHTILSDLTILQILEILTVHSHPSLDTSVSTHPQIQPLLHPSSNHFINIKQTFHLYFDIIKSKRKPEHPDIPTLKKDARTLGMVPAWGAHRQVNVLSEIQNALIKELEVFVQYFDILNSYTPSGDPIEDRDLWDLDDIPSLRILWTNIHSSEIALNTKKASQLTRIADLVSQNPLLLLPSTSDTQAPHPNALHRVEMFRQAATRMLKPQLHCSRIMSTHIFGGTGRLPIVPYDRTLKVLLKVFKKTHYTPYSDSKFILQSGVHQPSFVGRSIDRQVKKVDAIEPLDEREFEWLDSYLRVCRFVGGGARVEWREGVSVQEYWRVHVENTNV